MAHETTHEKKSRFSLMRGGKGQRVGPDDKESAGRSARPELPPLVLLSDDAAGPSVRRMTYFADATAACEHVDFWYPPEHRDRLIAFWALGSRPAPRDGEEMEVEALVLVRDHRDPELVSPFSFVDMKEALDFIREEMRYGLDPSMVVLYWAVPAEVQTTVFGDVKVIPERPPEVQRPMQVLWRESPAAATQAGSTRPADAARPKSQMEALLGELASALRAGPSEEPKPAFAGFGSPEGRF